MYYKIYIFLTLLRLLKKQQCDPMFLYLNLLLQNSLQNVVIVPLDPINSSMTSTTYYKIT